MNRKERRSADASSKASAIKWQGKTYSLEEANSLAISAHNSGDFSAAVQLYDRILYLHPALAEMYNNKGLVLQALGRMDEALSSFEKAINLKPDNAFAYNNRGVTLLQMERLDEALENTDKAISLNAASANARNSRAAILHKMKRFDEALASADKAIALKPDYAGAYQNRGLIMLAKGNMAEAENMFHKAHNLKPDFIDPLSSLISIHKYKSPDHTEVQFAHALLNNKLSDSDREYLLFALGKVYDDCGLWEEAFGYYAEANALRNKQVSYDAAATERLIQNIIDTFTADFLALAKTFKPSDDAPIFVVGMPRSGTTLMASILSSQPQIKSAGELPAMGELAASFTPYPQAVKALNDATAQKLIAMYEQRLRRDAGSEVPYVIDKHPLNFRHLGLIALLFPKARIIHCTRDLMDTALSNYFQRFTLHYDYAFDLRNIAHFITQYQKLMAHWQKVLPIKIFDAEYEAMTRDTEMLARSALQYLNLAWDDKCLSPHTNPAPIETASSWQVRQPIHTASLKRWKHYEKYLKPLKN